MSFTHMEQKLLDLVDILDRKVSMLSFLEYLKNEFDMQNRSKLFDILSPEKIQVTGGSEQFKIELAKKFANSIIKGHDLSVQRFGQAFADKLTAGVSLSFKGS